MTARQVIWEKNILVGSPPLTSLCTQPKDGISGKIPLAEL
jgi:hypothetical protein